MTDTNVTTESESSRKSPSNTVVLMVGNSIVGRFDPKESDEGKMTPAMRQAKRFLEEAYEDENHELHADLMAGRVEVMNAEVMKAGPQQKTVFSIG